MRIRHLSLAAAVVVLGACGDSTEPRVPTAVEVDPAVVNLDVGETVAVTAVVVDQNGRAYDVPPDGFAVSWSSQNTDVATVQNGQITGVGVGQTVVRATAGALPPADIEVDVEGTINITGSFNLPLLFEDDPDEMVVTAQVAFSYSGHRSGSLAVDNTFSLGEISSQDSYAFTFHNAEFDDQDFVAWQRRPDGLLDYMEFYVDGPITATGTATVYFGFILLGYDATEDTAHDFYLLEAIPGTVNITALTADGLAGTVDLSMDVEPLSDGISADGPAATRSWPRQIRPRLQIR